MSIFDNDRPLGYDEEKDAEAKIHPEPLGHSEKLAMDADDVEHFIEGYDKGEPLHGGSSAP